MSPQTNEINVRLATANDLPYILELVKEFLTSAPYDALEYNAAKVAGVFAKLIETQAQGYSAVIVADKLGLPCGLIAGTLHEFWHSKDRIAIELVWVVSPSMRGSGIGTKLTEAFEYWSERAGCKARTMSSPGSDAVNQALTKRGYSLMETGFIHKIENN